MPTSALGPGPENKILAEVHPPNLVIGGEFFSRSLSKNSSFKQEVSPISDVQRFLHIVVRDEHADALAPKLVHNLLNVLHRNGVHAREGFVEQNEGRVGSQGSRDFCSSSFTP